MHPEDPDARESAGIRTPREYEGDLNVDDRVGPDAIHACTAVNAALDPRPPPR